MNEGKEIPLLFDCDDAKLVGILHCPEKTAKIGVLIIVGGPQYRVGSHRQFLLLARRLCKHGYSVMRFDYRGMGDSDGLETSFVNVDEDIRVATDRFCAGVPGLDKIVIWGLCDAASAALFYAHQDSRISSLILLNPWVRTEEGMARAYLRHYYLKRFFDVDFLKKMISGRWNIFHSIISLLDLIRKLSRSSQVKKSEVEVRHKNMPLPDRMAYGFEMFQGRVLFILSGNNDYVADEFRDLLVVSRLWQRLMKRKHVQVKEIPGANHTFSRSDWREKVEESTLQWLSEIKSNY